MSKKLPSVTDRDVIKVAKKLGFAFYRQAKGSHEVWRRVSDGRHTVIPRHAGKIGIFSLIFFSCTPILFLPSHFLIQLFSKRFNVNIV